EEVWPRIAEFCGTDILVAHNGYQFDFPLLRRLTGAEPCTYDTLPLARELHSGSAKLQDLAARFGIDPGVSHRALDDPRALALGRYSDCLEYYRGERELAGDPTLPTVRELIERLGGEEAMQRIRAERSASERYPTAMARLRRLLGQCGGASLGDQISDFLERVALSSKDGVVPARERVNLLTLHSTKGLEFSRVYILGVEDAQLPGGTP